jgi:excisionase family DNA binding protein
VSYFRQEKGKEWKEYDWRMPTDVHERHLWLTPQEIAHELRVDVASVYRAVRRGDLPAVRLSHHGALRIHRSVLDQRSEQP